MSEEKVGSRLGGWLVSFKEHEGRVMESEGQMEGMGKKVLTWTCVVEDSVTGERYVSPHKIMSCSEIRAWAGKIMESEAERQRLKQTAKKPLIILPGGLHG